MHACMYVCVQKLTAEEKLIYQKYGKLPTKKDLVNHKLKARPFEHLRFPVLFSFLFYFPAGVSWFCYLVGSLPSLWDRSGTKIL